jgi:hypothetical protein
MREESSAVHGHSVMPQCSVRSARCAAAVGRMGARVAAETHLGSGAAAVVCEPHRAAHWLGWGAHVLSPRTLLRFGGAERLGGGLAVRAADLLATAVAHCCCRCAAR